MAGQRQGLNSGCARYGLSLHLSCTVIYSLLFVHHSCNSGADARVAEASGVAGLGALCKHLHVDTCTLFLVILTGYASRKRTLLPA